MCTGSGAVGAVLARRQPSARVLGTDSDGVAVRCARANGVDAHVGDLFDPLPTELRGQVDVIVSVPPYVPDGMLALLPSDVVAHEPASALNGGPDGLGFVRRIVESSPGWLRRSGSLVLETGIDQVESGVALFGQAGLARIEVVYDGDGDPCGVCGSTAAGSERSQEASISLRRWSAVR